MLWLWRMLRAGWDPWLELQQQETAWMRKGDRCCPQRATSLLFISFFFFLFGREGVKKSLCDLFLLSDDKEEGKRAGKEPSLGNTRLLLFFNKAENDLTETLG